jgi:hypothetical protein
MNDICEATTNCEDEWAGMAYTLCYSIHASSRVSVNGVWRLSS